MAYTSPETINWTDGIQVGFQYVNDVTNNVFMGAVLTAIYFLVLMAYATTRNDYFGAFATAGFVTCVFCFFMFLAGVVGWLVFGMTIGLAILGFASLLIDRGRD